MNDKDKRNLANFRDEVLLAMCIPYGWTPARLPFHCSYAHEVNVTHSLSCPHGGFPSISHNDIRDTTAQLLDQMFSHVSIEPVLQPLTGEQFRYRTVNVENHA